MVNPLNVLVGLVRFESMLALILAAVPIALRIADDRGSISAYHDMADPRWFFVPLTAASMMLITNGFVHSDVHGYNAALGVLLLGVVLFDHDGRSAIPHFLSAVPFFVLALIFVALMTTHYGNVLLRWPWRGRTAVLVALATALPLGVAWLVLEPPTFWLEAVGIWIIAAHYLYHSWWEIRRPADDKEPAVVLEQLFPRIFRWVAWILKPFTWLWNRLNDRRRTFVAQVGR